VDDLPILRLLPDDVSTLVVNSFVPATFAFGAVLARELFDPLRALTSIEGSP